MSCSVLAVKRSGTTLYKKVTVGQVHCIGEISVSPLEGRGDLLNLSRWVRVGDAVWTSAAF